MQLEATVGVLGGTIRYHLKSLREAGVVSVDEETKPKTTRLVDPGYVAKVLNRARPGWASGGIPRGPLWREVQAAIDKRRVRDTYRTKLSLRAPAESGFRRSP